MPAREYLCTVKELRWLTPSVFSVAFDPSKRFSYEPGQFLSVILPLGAKDTREVRRIYSFASAGKKSGYELCVQKVEGGRGSSYLASLKPGDQFRVTAPYGDFLFGTSSSRNACFIATGTGIAPFKAMVDSERFFKNPPQATVLLFGGRTESDILYPDFFEKRGVEVVHALSKPSASWNGFTGRVTDFLASLPQGWAWHETDFYLCGNGHMIRDVYEHLRTIRRVSNETIRQEAYFSTHSVPAAALPSLKKAA